MKIFKNLLCLNVLLTGVSCGTDSRNMGSLEQNTTDFKDLSRSSVHYRVISLSDSLRRSGINVQFANINHYAQTMKNSLGFEHQPEISFEYINAMLGKGLNKADLLTEGYYQSGLSNGELGLVMTTLKDILPQASSLNNNEIMVVLEDDVILPNDLPMSLSFALKQVPADADMLYLGCFQGVFANSNGTQKSPFYPNTYSKNEGFTGDLCPENALHGIPGTPWKKMTGGCVAGTWAYALFPGSSKKIQQLMKSFLPINGRFPIDEMYRILAEKSQINAYCLSPELVRPNYATPSTIRD